MKKAGIAHIVIAVAIIVLESLPYGAVLNFGEPDPSGKIGFIRKTYSYFSLTPFGNADFGPLLTAVLSCALLCLLVISLLLQKPALQSISRVLSVLALLTSLLPLLSGIEYTSGCGWAVSALLLLEIILLRIQKREMRIHHA